MEQREQAFDILVEAERRINAPAEFIYSLIANYTTHHSEFLPSAISNLVVEKGGIGEGTVIVFDVKLGGRTRKARARITEPRPGVLQETIVNDGTLTTFEVTQGSDSSLVRIRTELSSASGIQGWFERRFVPRMLRKVYEEELANLDAYALQQVARTINLREPVAAIA